MVSLKLAIRRYHNELHGMRQKDPSIDKVRSAESADARKEKKGPDSLGSCSHLSCPGAHRLNFISQSQTIAWLNTSLWDVNREHCQRYTETTRHHLSPN